MKTKRIEYIDAMRGFTMLLVVYSHIMWFCLGDRSMGFNNVFFLFRLPCFFFISGWLFYKPYSTSDVMPVVRKKFRIQIIPTIIFLLLLAPPPLFFSKLGALKGGYWFTFALFEFFVIYLCSALTVGKRRHGDMLMLLVTLCISVAAFLYDIFYNRIAHELGLAKDVLGFLSFMTWRYYLFFFLGAIAKKYFEPFLQLTSRKTTLAAFGIGFALLASLSQTDNLMIGYLVFAGGGMMGTTIVFAFFRTFASWFSHTHILGSALQYIGTHTLDIYLLHYFFLPRFLLPYGPQLKAYENPFLELATGLLLAIVITAISLLASRIIRLSPFLAHYLFGAQNPSKQRHPLQ